MPTTNQIQRIAKQAISELGKRDDVELKGDDLDLAEFYAEDAYGYINDITPNGIDPETHRRTLAKRAAIEYVKGFISRGDVEGSKTFQIALHKWRRKAAIQANEDKANDDEDYEFRLNRDY